MYPTRRMRINAVTASSQKWRGGQSSQPLHRNTFDDPIPQQPETGEDDLDSSDLGKGADEDPQSTKTTLLVAGAIALGLAIWAFSGPSKKGRKKASVSGVKKSKKRKR